MRQNRCHISVCICSYKRPELLAKLLTSLEDQDSTGIFTYSVVVVDNDQMGSAEKTVEDFRMRSSISISYHIEQEQNIALARNKAVANANSDFIAFIDDDELPEKTWLVSLYMTCIDYHADGVLGPVVPYYEVDAPEWVVRGKFFERPSHRTGEVLHWINTRTGNVLLRRGIFDNGENLFMEQFGRGGEDTDFFRRMIGKGFRFVWCEEAPVYEAVTAQRCRRSFLLRRALLRGRQPYFTKIDYAKSFVAVPLYTMALPFLLAVGHHIFMKYLIKDFDHIGRLLALCGIDVIKENYVSGR